MKGAHVLILVKLAKMCMVVGVMLFLVANQTIAKQGHNTGKTEDSNKQGTLVC